MADITVIGLVILNLALVVIAFAVCEKKDVWRCEAIVERGMRKSAEASENEISKAYSEMAKSYTEAAVNLRLLKEENEKLKRSIELKDRLLCGEKMQNAKC